MLTAILDDVTGPQQRRNPLYVRPLVEHIKGFLLHAKSLRNIETQQKRRGGVPSTPPPLVPRWGCDFACSSEG